MVNEDTTRDILFSDKKYRAVHAVLSFTEMYQSPLSTFSHLQSVLLKIFLNFYIITIVLLLLYQHITFQIVPLAS